MDINILGVSVVIFLLVLSRWAGFVMLSPFFGGKMVPPYVKLGLAVAFSLVVYPLVSKGVTPPNDPVAFAFAIMQETMVGLSIGFIVQKILYVLQSAGYIIDMQMGLVMGSMLDPVNGISSPLTGNLNVMLATMILLATNAHHYLIAAMVKSYDYIPLLSGGPNHNLINFGMEFLSGTFSDAVQIALPVVGVLIITEIALGFLARAVPQMNVFVLGFPIKIVLGFFIMFLLAPMLGSQVSSLFQDTIHQLQLFLQGWSQ